jgi:phosphatidylglycerol:prolipoprotein diacylglycerol transferase
MRFDAGIAALAGGLLTARMAALGAAWSFYAVRPEAWLRFWEGGLNWVGGVIGACLGLALYCRFTRRPIWPYLDLLAIPGAIVAMGAAAGCLLDGCAYGRPLEAGPLSADYLGTFLPRWPTQSIWLFYALLLLVALLHLRQRKWPAGARGSLFVGALTACGLALTFIRGDPAPTWMGMRVDALAAGWVLALALAFSLWRLRRSPLRSFDDRTHTGARANQHPPG